MALEVVKGILNVSVSTLNLRACLRGGMSFRWRLASETVNGEEYIGVVGEKIYNLFQNKVEKTIEYTVYLNASSEPDLKNLDISIRNELEDYFRLDVNLEDLFDEWSARDTLFKERINIYHSVLSGIRVLRQDPVENLFSFICSSNNNIKRITQMVDNLCVKFGEKIGSVNGQDYFAFPLIQRLAKPDVEAKLKSLSFGYRSKFIAEAAAYLVKKYEKPKEWLYSLRSIDYEDAHKELCKIYGVGNKVADCVCLMSLDKLKAIPVDTHILSIARDQYGFCTNLKKRKKAGNNLNNSEYRHIGDKFQKLWGDKAGWAQTIMFIDDLKGFKGSKDMTESIIPIKKSTSVLNVKIENLTDNAINPALNLANDVGFRMDGLKK